MSDADALLRALVGSPDDATLRLVYADALEERGHPGAAYLRAEVALSRAGRGGARKLRRTLLDLVPTVPAAWRDRFEQPDLLLAPPAPFAPGWYAANAAAPRPYRSLPNLDPDLLGPDLPWLPAGDADREDRDEHERDELAALAEVRRRAARLGLTLPPGFEAFARDFPRRASVSPGDSYFQMCLHDSTVTDFPRLGDGRLVVFFADMNYGNPHQLAWALYLVPGVAWHCVVGFELADDSENPLPDDPAAVTYCAPSFQAFLLRWRLENPA